MFAQRQAKAAEMRLPSLALLFGLWTLGVASAGSERVPQFSDFGVSGFYAGPRASPILNTPEKNAYRTRIRNAAKQPVNFAGGYVLEYWGCGTSCTNLVVVSIRTGEVFMPPFGAQGGESFYTPETADKFERLEWRLNSRLIVINGRRNEDEERDAHHYYEFDGRGFRHIRTIDAKAVAGAIAEPPPASSPPSDPAVSTAMPYIGRWASSHAQCRDPDADGITRFERNALVGYEHRCDFQKLDLDGETWKARGSCEGEGETWSSDVRFAVEGDTMVMQTDKGKPVALLRCE